MARRRSSPVSLLGRILRKKIGARSGVVSCEKRKGGPEPTFPPSFLFNGPLMSPLAAAQKEEKYHKPPFSFLFLFCVIASLAPRKRFWLLLLPKAPLYFSTAVALLSPAQITLYRTTLFARKRKRDIFRAQLTQMKGLFSSGSGRQ